VPNVLALTRSRLAAAIIAPVFLLVLFLTAALLGYAYVLVAVHDDEQAHRTADLVATMVASASGSFRSAESLQAYVELLAARGPATGVVVAAGRPLRVVASARVAERGLGLDQIADAELAAQVTAFATRGGGGIVDVGGGRSVIHVRRIELKSLPADGSGPAIALVGVRLDLAPLHWLSPSRAWSFVAWTVAASVIVVWIGLRILQRRVFDPLQAIERVIQARRAGERGARVKIDTADEFGDVAAELNAAMDITDARESQERATRKQVAATLTRFQQDLAYDLHDHVGGDLGGLAFRAKILAERLKSEARPEAKAAEDLTTALGSVADRTRALSRMLAPTSPEQGGLATALSRLCHSIHAYSGIEVTLRMVNDLPALADWRANHLFLIAQEALRNAVKHGKSSRIRVTLITRPDTILLRITSKQGRWDPQAQAEGLGMRILKFRADTLNAALAVRVRPSGITQVRLEIPVDTSDGAPPDETLAEP
jgi:signal transduction histidine kinase